MAKPIDDSQLLKLAADPRAPLFNAIRGGTVVSSLVVLGGLFSFLAVVLAGEMGDVDGVWALRALDLPTATEFQDWLQPGRHGWGSGALYQPPLATWVAALVIPHFNGELPVSWRFLSFLANSLSVWAMYLLGRRLGGASFGVAVVIAICGHPVILRLATGTSPAALGILWMTLTVWGYLGHLEAPPQFVSLRMLAGSIAWGLAFFTVGPVAAALFIPMLVHSWLLRGGRGDSHRSPLNRIWYLWLGLRTLTGFLITALCFSAWWPLMMMGDYGSDFWYSWWTGEINLVSPSTETVSFWRVWLHQNTYLAGFLAVGLFSAISELRAPATEIVRRRYQFVLLWWLTALAIRILFNAPFLCRTGLIDAWDGMLLLPTVLLATWGAQAIVLRQVQMGGETVLVILTLGLATWRMTNRPWIGCLGALLGLILISVLPTVVSRFRRGFRPWSERDWRLVLQFSCITIALAHVASGLAEFPSPSSESRTLTEFRKRVSALSRRSRVMLVSPNRSVPESVLFVIRSHFPDATLQAGSRDGGGTREFTRIPQVGEMVVEWTQYEVSTVNDLPADRQAAPIGDPLRFRGRRLIIYSVQPRQL